MKKYRILVSLVLLSSFIGVGTKAMPVMDIPEVILTGVPFEISVSDFDQERVCDYELVIDQTIYQPTECNESVLSFEFLSIAERSSNQLSLQIGDQQISSKELNVLWGWISIMPPLISILVALFFRSVIPALFLGVWIGSFSILGFKISVFWQSFLDVIAKYVKQALADPDHAAIIIFSLMIGGLVGIISRNGGMLGIVNALKAFTTSAKRGQLITSTLGLTIFFDDYANTLVVGNTMRKVTDRLKISRAKLAFLVDATAAPVACIALITTWVGYQIGMIDVSVDQIDAIDQSAYSIYLNSILYSFYPIFMLVFVFTIAGTGRDFSTMYDYEVAARQGNDRSIQGASGGYTNESESKQLEAKDPDRARAVNAFLPILAFIISVVSGLFATGEGDNIQDIIGSADAYQALLWGSLIGVMTAFLLSVSQGLMSLEETVQSWYEGVKFMIFAIIVLILAWSLGQTTELLQTAQYLVSILGEFLPVAYVPTIIFILAAATAFATGTSWGTMGIFYPIVIPLAWQVLFINGVADVEHMYIIYSSVACVLCGAVWGDHCSPISDTTIMSSMASGCNHIDHVATQFPYAMIVGSIALLLGTIPTGYGWSPLLMIPLGVLMIFTVIFLFGKRID
jgi:Na+/H+ antiporter NhaC